MGREVGPKNSTDREQCSTFNGFIVQKRNPRLPEQDKERAGKGLATGGQTGRRGAGNGEAARPAGTRQQAGGQTGEGSVTGSALEKLFWSRGKAL